MFMLFVRQHSTWDYYVDNWISNLLNPSIKQDYHLYIK